MSDILEKTDEKVDTTNGDHDKFSHYVLKNAQMDGLLRISPAVALCGKTWYPDEIDVTQEKHTICPDCKKKYEEMAE